MLGKSRQAGIDATEGKERSPVLTEISPEAIAERIWPYLQAYQDDDMTGEKEFDEQVCSVRDLALFLARRIIDTPYDDLVYRGHKEDIRNEQGLIHPV